MRNQASLWQPASQAENPLRGRPPFAPRERTPGDVADPEGDEEQRESEEPGGGHPSAACQPYALGQEKSGRRVEIHSRRRRRRDELLVAAPDFLCLCHAASLISEWLTLLYSVYESGKHGEGSIAGCPGDRALADGVRGYRARRRAMRRSPRLMLAPAA